MTRHEPAVDADTPLAWCARVVELIHAQTRAFEQLGAIAGHDASGQPDPGAVLAVIDARSPVIERITQIDAQLTALQPAWDRQMRQLAPDDRDRIHAAIAALQAASDRIAREDRCVRDRLQRQRDAIADQLLSLSRGRSAAGAYAGSGPAAPRFQDREA